MSDHKVPPGYTFKGESPDGTIVATQQLTNHDTGKVIGYNNAIVDAGGKILRIFQTWIYPEGGAATGLPNKASGPSGQSDIDKQKAEQLAARKEKEKEQREKDAVAKAAAAGGSGSGSSNGTGASDGTSTDQSGSRQTSSATRGDHSHIVHGAVDTSANWKTVSADGNQIVTRNDDTHTTMTHKRDGTILEQVDGKHAFRVSGPTGVSSDSSSSLDFVSENGSRANLHLASNNDNLNATSTANLDKSITRLENSQAEDALARAVDKPSNTWHANPSWEAPNADNKAAISQIAPSIDTNNVLEVRLGEHNNYLLRMNDGSYQSIDLNSGNVSGAGTWNKSQWADSGYGGSNSSSNDTATTSPATVATAPNPPATGRSAQELLYGFDNSSSGAASPAPASTSTQSQNTTLADQFSGHSDPAAIDKSLRDMGIVPATTAVPAASSAPDTGDVVSRALANQSMAPASEPFTLPGATKQADQFAVSLDPPSSGPSLMERHFKAGRDIE